MTGVKRDREQTTQETRKKAKEMTLDEKAKTFDIPHEGKCGNDYLDIRCAILGMKYRLTNDGIAIGKGHHWHKQLCECQKILGDEFPPAAQNVLELIRFDERLADQAPSWDDVDSEDHETRDELYEFWAWRRDEDNEFENALEKAQDEATLLAYDLLNGSALVT